MVRRGHGLGWPVNGRCGRRAHRRPLSEVARWTGGPRRAGGIEPCRFPCSRPGRARAPRHRAPGDRTSAPAPAGRARGCGGGDGPEGADGRRPADRARWTACARPSSPWRRRRAPEDAARELAEHAIALLGAPSAVVLIEGIGDTVRVTAGDTTGSVFGDGSRMRLLDDAGVPCGSIAVSARGGRPRLHGAAGAHARRAGAARRRPPCTASRCSPR